MPLQSSLGSSPAGVARCNDAGESFAGVKNDEPVAKRRLKLASTIEPPTVKGAARYLLLQWLNACEAATLGLATLDPAGLPARRVFEQRAARDNGSTRGLGAAFARG
jgi:hypothetical protein